MWLLWLLSACATPPPATPAPAPVAAPAPASLALTWKTAVVGGAQEGDTLPIIVVVHGLGDRPESMLRLFGGYPEPARIVAPAGPTPRNRGFSWFSTRRTAKGIQVEPTELTDAADAVATLTRTLSQRFPSRGRPVITGFSQGGMVSFVAATRPDTPFAGAVPMGGWLPPALWPDAVPATPVPIVALHGTDDDVVPLAPTEDAVRHLVGLGWPASLRRFDGVRHQVPAEMRQALYQEVQRLQR